MTSHFLHLATTPAVRTEQARYYGNAQPVDEASQPDRLGEAEAEFIAQRDSFYLATVTETGWPYLQHRGGPRGFLKIFGPATLGFADVRGNRQMLSAGNLAANDRVALLLMDYPQRSRLKILGRARMMPAAGDPGLAAQLKAGPGVVERLTVIDVLGFDWNCPKYITPRYSLDEIEELTAPLHARIAKLEAELRART